MSLCLLKDSARFFRVGEHCNSATGPEDIRRVPAPSFRQAFVKRRCLIPSDGFYEWKKVPGGKIPHSISMKDDSPFVFAGLWEGWKDPASGEAGEWRPDDDPASQPGIFELVDTPDSFTAS